MKLGDNIKKIRELWELSQEEFGQLIGATRGMVMQYEKRGSTPKSHIINAIVQVTGIAIETLMNKDLHLDQCPKMSTESKLKIEEFRRKTGNGEVSEKNETVSKTKESFKLAGRPYYDIDATAGNVTVFNGESPELIKEYIAIPSFQSCKMFVNVKGHSMYPKYQSGDIIGLIPIEDMSIIQYGEAYLIVTMDSQRMIKTIRKHKDNNALISLCNENEKFDNFDIPKEKVLKLFLIKGPIRDGVMG